MWLWFLVLQGFVNGIVANWFIPYYWSRFGAWSTTYRCAAAAAAAAAAD
jgi:hypothetical protein